MQGKTNSKQKSAARSSRSNLIRTVFMMLLCGVFLFVPLGMQLYNIQITQHDFYEQKAVEQQTRDTVITPARGTIYDRNMTPLAVSASVETVFIAPAEIKSDEQAEVIARGLSQLLDVEYEKVLAKTKKKNSYYETVKTKIEKELADQVRKFVIDNKLKGIHLEADTKRYYTNANFASHIIGFVRSDNVGAEGIEALYEPFLKGTPGRVIAAKNAKGTDMPFNYEKYYDAENGQGVVLTIDETVQHFLERHLETAMVENEVTERAAGIVMNVKTGEILAMATKPDYDPNNPRSVTDEEILKQMSLASEEDKNKLLREAQLAMWRDKPVVDSYEPGSTFKIITTAVALEEKVVSLNDRFFCGGSIRVPGWSQPIGCWKHAGHGSETFAEGVQNSCNVVFVNVGQRIGAETFYKYMEAFGFMDKTGVDLPGEAKGIVTDYSTFSQSLVPVSVYSFGQTFKITAMQLITAVSAVANGGKLMEPHIVRELVDQDGTVTQTFEPKVVRQVISEETSKQVCALLESVVTEGTGKNAYVKGFRIGGKTGTGEKRDLPAEQRDGNYVVSFVGIAPADDPEIAVLVLLDHPVGKSKNMRTGGQMVAPVVGRIMADVLPYLGVQPVYSAEELSGVDITTPSLSGMTRDAAVKLLNEKKLKYRTVGDGDTVTDQVPAVGAKVPNTAEIVLYLGAEKPEGSVKVPNVNGMSAERANAAITNAGLYMKATGATSTHGSSIVAVKQNVAEGAAVQRGSVIEVEFRDLNALDH